MTGRPSPTFRLLDARVGWDVADPDGLVGAVLDEGVLRLQATDRSSTDPRRVPPPALARGCGGCGWWLATDDGLLHLGDCDERFLPWTAKGRPLRAVAARGTLVAVLDGDDVRVFSHRDGRLVGHAEVPGATAISLTPWGTLLVGDGGGRLHDHDLSGLPGDLWSLPSGAAVRAIVHDTDAACSTLIAHADGDVTVLVGGTAEPASPERLNTLPDSGVEAVSASGFCLSGRGCHGWDGARLESGVTGDGDARHVIRGQLLTAPLDSGIPRCRWHRVRVDADVPEGTTVSVAVATTDDATPRPRRPSPPRPWSAFPPGEPHPDDWHDAGPGVTDFLVDAPPGRWGYVRVRLTGPGPVSPAVHQVRLDFPRVTSLDTLPAAFAEDPRAADFTERFLSLFDAELEEADEVLERRAALLDAAALPDDALAWLGSFLGLGFEAEMTPGRRRALLAAAPALFRRRGTPAGLVETLRIALGVDASIEELGGQRPWAALGHGARLGAVRLFGRSCARVRLGTTVLGNAPLKARGNPDDDARLAGAHRFSVHVAGGRDVDRDLVRRVVRSQSPASTEPSVRFADRGLWLGTPRVGIDTALLPPGPLVLGDARLGHEGVLRTGRRGCAPMVVGGPVVIGHRTRLERPT